MRPFAIARSARWPMFCSEDGVQRPPAIPRRLAQRDSPRLLPSQTISRQEFMDTSPDFSYAEQAIAAFGYYACLLLMIRLAGKRLAGQTTTFDLLVLITLGVVLQSWLLSKNGWNPVIFVVVVFTTHRLLALACARSKWLRAIVRGSPQPLVKDGVILEQALQKEGISRDELLAGLRKHGHRSEKEVQLAVLEETGHISAIPFDASQAGKVADSQYPTDSK